MKGKDDLYNRGPISFLPLVTFLIVYLGAGIFFSIIGISNPFKQVSREFAVLCGLLVVILLSRGPSILKAIDFDIDIVAKHCGESNCMLMILIFTLAGAFSGAAAAMGGQTSAVNLGLTVIPQQYLFGGIFIIAAFLATAMGTSMGTIAAIGPIALGLAQEAEISEAFAIAAVLGGAMFGDNLSIISDTTIAATRSAGCEMKDKFRMNLKIAFPAAILTILFYCFIGSGGNAHSVYDYSYINILPYVLVLITALLGVNVILVLMIGTICCGIIGMSTGALTIVTFSQAVTKGIGGMLSIIIVTIIIRGLTGIAVEYKGLEWLVSKASRYMNSRGSAEMGMGLLTGLIDVSMGNNTIAILVSGPVAVRFAKLYNIAPKRVASLLDIFACVFQSYIPHGGQMMLCMALSGLSPIAIIEACYYPALLLIATLITIKFGLLKTKEEKEHIKMYPESDV